MNGQMDLEFMDDDRLAGFRLSRIELYNWGTFHDKVWSLHPAGKNILVTGDIGTGKSTIVDALTTLLVPAHRISYNKAAGAETRERTLRSYIQGYYKTERSEDGYRARPVPLRDYNSYSVILGVFTNSGFGQTVTLAQVFWQKDQAGQPDRFYLVADADLSISGHFAGFGPDIRELKKRLKAMEHVDEVYDRYPPYAMSFRRRFGIVNDQALELFLQTVSMKTVGNLTDFVRAHMLESFDIGERIEALIAHFDDLNTAHNAVLKAKNQLEKLAPLVKDLDRHAEVTGARESLRTCRDGLRSYFSRLKAGLLEKRIANLDEERRKVEARILQIDERLSHEQAERDNIRQAISRNGGDRLERLKTDIGTLLDNKKARLRKAEEYREIASKSSIPFDGSMDAFLNNRNSIDTELKRTDERETALHNSRVEAEVEFKGLRDAHKEVHEELESLRKRKSNIDSVQIGIRKDMCRETDIDENEMPFAGELLMVRPDESRWEGAIERLLRNFGLSLLVPERYYPAVSEWVDRTNCRGRIVYFKISAKQSRGDEDLHPESLVRKLDIKPGSELSSWISAELARRFDYACCDSMEKFRREKLAITVAGQIKGAGNRHEKDDRRDIKDRSRYVLGWNNEAKMASLQERLVRFEKEIASKGTAIGSIQNEIKIASERKTLLTRLDGFRSWEEIDWQPISLQIDELEREKKELQEASNILATLNCQLEQIETAISELRDKRDREKETGAKNAEKKEQASMSLEQCREVIAAAGPEDTNLTRQLNEYRSTALGNHAITLESADHRQQDVREWIQAKIDAEDKRLKSLEEKIIRTMQDYRREYVAETTDIDARLESAPEFRAMMARLEKDDLPRFESRFKDLLNENTIREIANFQSQLNRGRQVIRERIEKINQSLSNIEYNKGRYISLEAQDSPDAEIRDFRQSLKACTEGSLTGSEDEQYAEAKFLQVRAIIDRFRGRDSCSDIDKRWTVKVTDVRNWFVFAASERWIEDGKEYEHYTDSGGKSGGQKEKLAYTVLAASLAYQFGLSWGEVKSRSFRFVVIDEAFGRGSDESARFGLELFNRLNMQLLIVTPLQKIHIIEPYVSNVGFVDSPEGRESRIRNLTIEEYRTEKEARLR
ncbi:MAG: ATP-dependent exonuclease SbcCD, C subunit-like protein [Spirochaetes bacterium]|nr:MAG: ATP-dependent exonuclease SbcCD, C subunit-like protein [Spirochaetota bacterium]